MSVTYTVTEADGTKHSRTSRDHATPQYLFAVVRVPGGDKGDVSYCGRRDLAEKALTEARKPRTWEPRKGEPLYPDAKIYPVEAVVKGARVTTATTGPEEAAARRVGMIG